MAMDGYLADNALGLFLLDEEGQVRDSWIFSKDPNESAEILAKMYASETVKQEKKLLNSLLKSDLAAIKCDNQELVEALKPRIRNLVFVKPCDRIDAFRESFADYAVSTGLLNSKEEWDRFTREFALHLARQRVAVKAARRDLAIAQMVRAIDDLDKSLNLFSGRVREWYGLHFPELDKHIESHETYLRLVSELGRREEWTMRRLSDLGVEPGKATALTAGAQKSMGAEFAESDIRKLQEMCAQALGLHRLREDLAKHTETVLKEIAPNLLAVAGPLIAARLISIAGSIENLAKLPSSTIQVLGAEKALFRALRTGARPPKHGVIFQYGSIHQAPRWQRGKLARALSGKLAIAARLDAFAGEFEGDRLKSEFEDRLQEIQLKYANPPEKVTRGRRERHDKKARKR